MGKKLTKEEFILRSSLKHDNKYDYSLVNYINLRTKIKILCPIHGLFEQKSDGHLNGVGCPKCYGNKLLTTESFIDKAKILHGERYNYSLVNYKDYDTKVNIICDKHGIFEQTPNNHLSPSGCPKCRKSKGEILIIKFLNDNNIKFIEQFKFNNCVGSNFNYKLRFDFYLPDYKTVIEYDGIQHFEPIRFNGCCIEKANISFNNTKYNDEIKTKYCLENHIMKKILKIVLWKN